MVSEPLRTPVALFVFRRLDTTRRVFDAISNVRPTKLLLVADGPRLDREGEVEACRLVREMLKGVNWPCEIHQNYSDTNLGCQERMISGLNWVFSQVDEAIILEDDCLADSSFFFFCQELLERYRGDQRVASISGTNLVEKFLKTDASYYFSQIGGNWGWATWRAKWQHFDRHIVDWPTLKAERTLSEIFDEPKMVAYWSHNFDKMHENNGPSAWDYQWLYAHFKNHALAIVPSVNLVANIGFGLDATHTTLTDDRLSPPVGVMKFPLRHPSSFVPLRSIDRKLQQLYFAPYSLRVMRRLRRIAKGFVG
jgi:hypothetical protein